MWKEVAIVARTVFWMILIQRYDQMSPLYYSITFIFTVSLRVLLRLE